MLPEGSRGMLPAGSRGMLRFDHVRVARAGLIVVDDWSCEVPAGQTLAIIGRTGAGKTSLLEAAAGDVPLLSGDIQIARGGRAGVGGIGCSIRREAAAFRRLLGVVPDRLPAWPGLHAAGLLELSATAAGLTGPAVASAVARALAVAGLVDRATTPLDSLPPGQAKRLLFGRALLHDPPVLLLDDPCGGLDPHERDDMVRRIAAARAAGTTVVATLDDAVVPACFSHVAVMAEGRLVAAGPADPAGFGIGRHWRVRLECPGHAAAAAALLDGVAADVRAVGDAVECRLELAGTPVSQLVRALVAAGIPVEAAGLHPPWTCQLLD